MKIKRNSARGGVTMELKARDEPMLDAGFKAALDAASVLHLKTILVPVDFSEHSAKAVRYAAAFARQFGAKLVLVHVVEPVVVPDTFGIIPPNYEDINDQISRTAEGRLKAFAEECSGRQIKVRPMVCTGRAPWEIIRVAREAEADLIIIATHGYTGLKHVVLGSTAELVVRHAPCPVLTVRKVEHDFVATG